MADWSEDMMKNWSDAQRRYWDAWSDLSKMGQPGAQPGLAHPRLALRDSVHLLGRKVWSNGGKPLAHIPRPARPPMRSSAWSKWARCT